MQRSDYTAGLRAIAAFYDEHPEIHLPCANDATHEVFTNYFCSSAENMALVAVALKPCQKIWPDDDKPYADFFLEREMAPGIFLRFRTRRDVVCRKVTKTVPARTIEIPAETVEVWECDGSLLDAVEREHQSIGAAEVGSVADILTPAHMEAAIEQRRDAEASLERTSEILIGAGAGVLVEGVPADVRAFWRHKPGEIPLSEIRDQIVAGNVEINPAGGQPFLTAAGAALLATHTGIPFAAGDPVPAIAAEDQEAAE